MHANRLTARSGAIAVALGVLAWIGRAAAQTTGPEMNGWPVLVRQADPAGQTQTWTGAGPLFFGKPNSDGGTVSGFRPIWVQNDDAKGEFRSGYFLYPVFSYRVDETTYRWNVLELIRREGRPAGAPAPISAFEPRGSFEIWPFWFSHQSADPALSYRGLFPIAGTVRGKLSFDRASWVLFPLYANTDKRGVITTSVPWPFVRITRGAAHGFGIWPLFETKERPGVWRQEYFLWPLGYNLTTYPAADAPAGTAPIREIGALPLYAQRTAPGYIDQSFIWPFFGYTDRTAPSRYHETRYLWPFLVQGRGDAHYVNRWGPFYTHSVMNGYDKTWYAWPLVRHASWTDRGLAVSKTQVFYFLYWSERQRSARRPDAPAASLTHVWPLFSSWNNGAGRRQFQFFSPLDVFFPGNEKIQTIWSPLFAIARRDESGPGESRTSLLWNAITWQRNEAAQAREFHLGPVMSVATRGAQERIAIGNGLVAFDRDPAGRWHVSWLDFRSQPAWAAKPTALQ